MKKLLIIAVALVSLTALAGESFNDLLSRAIRTMNRENWAEAERLYQQILVEYPDTKQKAVILSNIAMMQSNQGRNADALGTLDAAMAVDSTDVSIILTRATVRYAEGDDDGAIADYSRIIALEDTNTNARHMRGSIALMRGDTVTALADFSRLRELVPGSLWVHKAFAAYYTKTKDWGKSLAEYDSVIAKEPDVESYLGRAAVEIMMDRLDEASADIAEAMRQAPEDGEAYYLRAGLNKRRYLFDEAKADGRRAIELGVDARRVRALLGVGPDQL